MLKYLEVSSNFGINFLYCHVKVKDPGSSWLKGPMFWLELQKDSNTRCENWPNRTLRIPSRVSFIDFNKNIVVFYLVTKITGFFCSTLKLKFYGTHIVLAPNQCSQKSAKL